MWFKLDAPGVVFLVNAESVDAAETHVHGLPLGQAGLMDFLHPGRAAGPARHADRRKVSVPGAADRTSVPILIAGAAGATGSVATGGLTGAGASALLCFRIDLCCAADFCCARATLRRSVAPAEHQSEVRPADEGDAPRSGRGVHE